MCSKETKPTTWADAFIWVAVILLLGFCFHECASCQKARDAQTLEQKDLPK